MGEQEHDLLQPKAEAFDRIADRYNNLRNKDGFYSQNWVELADAIEAELKTLDQKRRRHSSR